MEAIDPSVIVLATAAAVTMLTAIAKMAGIASTPARTVATAGAGAAALVVLYAVSNGLLAIENAFGLVAGAILVVGAAVGLHEVNARTSKPPAPTRTR